WLILGSGILPKGDYRRPHNAVESARTSSLDDTRRTTTTVFTPPWARPCINSRLRRGAGLAHTRSPRLKL
ncbi:MAG: hypothetical protein ACR2G6_14230, partial [Gemmatimonadaceae bacterium]